jgi:hypothetical protein
LIVIGDSHTWVFKGYCEVVHIDNPTAHNIHNHQDAIEKALKKDDINLFSFGDLDCRVHLYNIHKKTGIPLSKLMHNTVERFLCFILHYPEYDIRVLSLPPCGTQENRFNKEYYANYVTRKYIYFQFNHILESACVLCDIPFINYYYDVVNQNMDRRPELVADDILLNKKALPYILERLL